MPQPCFWFCASVLQTLARFFWDRYLCSIPGPAFSSLRLRLVLGGVLDVVCVDRLAMSVAIGVIGLVLERVGGRWVELRTAGGT